MSPVVAVLGQAWVLIETQICVSFLGQVWVLIGTYISEMRENVGSDGDWD